MLHCLSVEVKFDLSQRLFGQYLLTLYLLRCCGEIFHWTSENTKAGEFVVCFKGVRCYDNWRISCKSQFWVFCNLDRVHLQDLTDRVDLVLLRIVLLGLDRNNYSKVLYKLVNFLLTLAVGLIFALFYNDRRASSIRGRKTCALKNKLFFVLNACHFECV